MNILCKPARWCAAVLALWAAVPVAQAQSIAAQPSAAAIGALKPGKYVWKASATGQVADHVIISIADQRAYVYRGRTLIAVSTVSTGAPGNDTPTGEFEILQKKMKHNSNLYDNASMPYMQRLTWDGVAIHAGHNPGFAASHGCIRVPAGFAKKLYSATKLRGKVSIIDTTFDPSAPENMGSWDTVAASAPATPVPATPAPATPAPATPSETVSGRP